MIDNQIPKANCLKPRGKTVNNTIKTLLIKVIVS